MLCKSLQTHQRRVGHSLKRAHCKRNLVPSRKQAAYKLSKTQSTFSSLKRVPRPLFRQDSTCSNRQHHSGVIYKQGRRLEVWPTVCPSMENLDLVYQKSSISQSPTHPRRAEGGTRQAIQTILTEWSLLPEVIQTICSRWHQPKIDLFDTRFNNKLPLFVLPVPDPLATAVDALSLPWEDLDSYAFPPEPSWASGGEVAGLPMQENHSDCSWWPNMPWFWDLVAMSSQIPLSFSCLPNLITQPFNQIPHRNLTNLNLHAWLLEPQQSRSRASLRQWQQD